MSGFLCSMVGATYAAAVVNTAVSFDGNEDYYSATGLTTTATDSKYMTLAFTFYLPSSATGKFMDILGIELGGGSGQIGYWTVLQSTRLHNYFTNSAGGTGQTYGDFEITTSNVYHQIVYYHDATSFSNCKYYVDGVDRTSSSLLNGPSFGEPAMSNVDFNWGATGAKVYIGNGIIGTGFDASDEFDGRISQLYLHNASGAPVISKFWNTTTNLPLDLGTNGTATGLAQPLIYHYGNTSTFPTNNGTGFNSYTLTASGTPTSAAGPTYGTIPAVVTPSGVEFQRASSERIKVTGFSSNVQARIQVASYWFKLASSPTGDETILSAAYSDGNAPILCELTGGNVRHYVHTGSSFTDYQYTPATAFAAGTWYHIITKSNTSGSGRSQIWINGVRVNDQAHFGTSANVFGVGSTDTSGNGYGIANYSANATRLWNGCIAQVYWYAGDIDIDTNIAKFYNNGYVDFGTAGTTSGLPTPHIYHYGSTQATFDDVRGSLGGSTVTVTGTLSACT